MGAPTREDGKYGSKDAVIGLILEAQKRHDERVEEFCEICGVMSSFDKKRIWLLKVVTPG